MVRVEGKNEVDGLAKEFRNAQPFRHVVIDDFLDPGLAERLLAEFPDFDPARAISENGVVGNKAVNERLRMLGPAFVQFDDMAKSQEFLALVSAITGIPGLVHDPAYVGGGTHENRDRQGLDAHVDFNRHPVSHDHRRLNLIVYLNHQWSDAWGGVLELHRDPRAADDEVVRVSPQFNRAVIFETTERSWHGFSTIRLPEDQQQRSRRSVALYYYSRQRAPEELAATHSTIYVDRPLADSFVPGLVLQAGDVQELRHLLGNRDRHIQRLYRDLQDAEAKVEATLRALGLLRGTRSYRLLMAMRRAYRRVVPRRG
ncbi:hypothetical protein BH11PSE14_BH11PSE14_08910 [soil metagenome]